MKNSCLPWIGSNLSDPFDSSLPACADYEALMEHLPVPNHPERGDICTLQSQLSAEMQRHKLNLSRPHLCTPRSEGWTQTAWHAVIPAGIQLHFWDKSMPKLEIWYEHSCAEAFRAKSWFEKGKHHFNLAPGEPERNPYSAPACISLGRQEGIKTRHNWSNSSRREGWICYCNIWKHSWGNFVASCPWGTGLHFGYISELNFITGTGFFSEFHSQIFDWQESVMKQNHSTAVRQMNLPHI